MPHAVYILFLFALGACVGSFLNVVVYRLPRQLSFVKGRSFCPDCRRQLSPWDMLPILSWLLLRGRGRGSQG